MAWTGGRGGPDQAGQGPPRHARHVGRPPMKPIMSLVLHCQMPFTVELDSAVEREGPSVDPRASSAQTWTLDDARFVNSYVIFVLRLAAAMHAASAVSPVSSLQPTAASAAPFLQDGDLTSNSSLQWKWNVVPFPGS